jgi:cell division protein FtsN
MTENLKGQGFGAFYIKADITDKKTAATKTWYRVSVGLFQTQKEADAYKADLLSRSKVSSAIVQRVTK